LANTNAHKLKLCAIPVLLISLFTEVGNSYNPPSPARPPVTVAFMMFKNFLANKESKNCNEYKADSKIKARTAIAKAAFNKETLFTSKLDLNVRNIVMKCYICCIALYDAKTWVLWKTAQKCFGSFKMWCWRRIDVIWTYHVRN